MNSLVNLTYDEISIGSTATFPHRLTRMEVDALAFVSGETDGFQVETGDGASSEQDAEAVAGEALISALLKRRLPGPGTTIVAQDLVFSGQLSPGDVVLGTVIAREKHDNGKLIVFDCLLTQGEQTIVKGQ